MPKTDLCNSKVEGLKRPGGRNSKNLTRRRDIEAKMQLLPNNTVNVWFLVNEKTCNKCKLNKWSIE